MGRGTADLVAQTPQPDLGKSQYIMTLRILTAVVAIPAIFGILWIGTLAVAVVALIAASISGWELADMVRARKNCPLRWAYVGWPISFVSAGWLIAENQLDWLVLPSLIVAGMIPALYLLVTGRRTPFVYSLAAGPYVGLTLAHAPVLRSSDNGMEWLLFALIVTFTADTAAMFIGVAFGRHKLITRISPKKSWEGVVGGLVGGGISAFIIGMVFDLQINSMVVVGLGLSMAIAGTLGDLGESAFKRHAAVKDSGFLIPGHGGVLDRLDSLMPNLLIVYWVSEWSAT